MISATVCAKFFASIEMTQFLELYRFIKLMTLALNHNKNYEQKTCKIIS